MKNTSFILFFLPLLYFSQSIRFTYNYEFVSDTLTRDVVSNETVVLDYFKKEQRSFFTGLKHIISDSTMIEDSKKGIHSFPDGSTKIRYVVEKINNGNLMYFYTTNHMPDPVLKVNDERRMKWEITNEQEKILGYLAQKATTFFAGRQWTAWFTTEISIPDGPYKFHGLPGLILKIVDETQTHSFDIISVKNQKSSYYILNENAYPKVKQIVQKDYENMPDPAELFKQKVLADGIFHSNDEKQTFIRDIDAQIEKSKIHDNNPIELYKK
ncbi:GLPGLI family protein [Epilithonimonas sp.]|uniref:GLPGLI family protein n=1 Tax=Epilithonimonas sp. TaxID=2894511 RepID=UPI00289A2A12|nr:GLPGLI family protein [Epilithonimonas sp.]